MWAEASCRKSGLPRLLAKSTRFFSCDAGKDIRRNMR
jgi:hypothetical protein